MRFERATSREEQLFLDLARRSCAADTSETPEKWHDQNPFLGHSAVVALAALDHFGESHCEILSAKAHPKLSSLAGESITSARTYLIWFHDRDPELIDRTGSCVDFSQEQFERLWGTENFDTQIDTIPCAPDFMTMRDYLLSDPQTNERYEKFTERLAAIKPEIQSPMPT